MIKIAFRPNNSLFQSLFLFIHRRFRGAIAVTTGLNLVSRKSPQAIYFDKNGRFKKRSKTRFGMTKRNYQHTPGAQ